MPVDPGVVVRVVATLPTLPPPRTARMAVDRRRRRGGRQRVAAGGTTVYRVRDFGEEMIERV